MGSSAIRIFLLVPENEEVVSALKLCRKKYAQQPWIVTASIAEGENVDARAQAIAERLAQEDCTSGYVLEDYPRSVEELQALDRCLRSVDKKARLPLALYWHGPAQKDQREQVKEFRELYFPLSEYMYENRRMLAVPKLTKMKAAFAEAQQRAKKVQLFRKGTIGAFVACCVIFVVALMFFRDPWMKSLLVNYAQEKLQARFDIETFETSLSDAGIHLKNVAAADAQNPMRNVFAWESLQASWKLGALMSAKLHAQELFVEGLRFDTQRSESGVLAERAGDSALSAENTESVEDPTTDNAQSSAFLDAMNNALGAFKPPALDDLSSSILLKKLQTDAESRQQKIRAQAQGIDVQAALAQSQQAAEKMKTVSLAAVKDDGVAADLKANSEKIKLLQDQSIADFTAIEATLKKLQALKISGPADIVTAKKMISDSKNVQQKTKNIRAQIASTKQIIASSRQRVVDAGKDIEKAANVAKQELQDGIQKVRAPIDQTRTAVTILFAEGKSAARTLRTSREKLRAAIAEDIAAGKQQYAVEGLQKGLQQMLSDLMGQALYETLNSGMSYYRIVQPWLPVTEKTTQTKSQVESGTDFDFALPVAEGGMPALWIKKALLSGEFILMDKKMHFSATLNDMSSNLAFTQKPITLQATAKSVDSAQDVGLVLDLRYQDTGATAGVTGTVEMRGLRIEQQPIVVTGAMAGLAPQAISCEQLQVDISELCIDENRRDALLKITMKGVQLTAASAAEVSPELAAVFSETYAQIQDLTIYIGIGKHKSLRTEPDMAKMLTAGLRARVEERLAAASKKTSARIRQQGAQQEAQLEKIAQSFDNMQELTDKRTELQAAEKQFANIEHAQRARLQSDQVSAQKSLSVYDADLAAQDRVLSDQENKMQEFINKIEKEKKRLQKKMLGGGLKDLLKRF